MSVKSHGIESFGAMLETMGAFMALLNRKRKELSERKERYRYLNNARE